MSILCSFDRSWCCRNLYTSARRDSANVKAMQNRRRREVSGSLASFGGTVDSIYCALSVTCTKIYELASYNYSSKLYMSISGVARNLCTGVLNYSREARAQNI